MSVDRPELDRVLSCSTLPSLPSVGLEVLRLTRNPSVSAEQIAKVIETDPALSAKVLKTVNSSLYSLKDPCTTIRRALGYLGLAAVKSLVLGFSLMDSSKNISAAGAQGMDEYWKRTIYSACGARAIAMQTKAFDPDEAFTAALFQDLGALAMFAAIPEEYATLIATAPTEHAKHSELEQSALGFTHTEAGSALAANWRLPDRYIQTIRFHHEPDQADAANRTLVRCVALGTNIGLTLTATDPAPHLATLLSQLWFNIAPEDMKAQLLKIGPAARELAKMFEKPLGKLPDINGIMAQANEELVMQQMAAMREAEELRLRNENLQKQAYTDGLTGLANRKKFDELASKLFPEARDLGRTLAVVMVDGDKFKSVNDTHGHHVGDAVLKELAKRISTTVGERGTACRYGGEEFSVLLPGLTLSEAAAVAESIRAALANTPFDLTGVDRAPASLPITASFGVSCIDIGAGKGFATFSSLLEAADRALYSAKHSGRNRVCTEDAPEQKPATPPPAQAKIAEVKEPPTRVLLIEDDALAAKLLITLMQKTKGVEVEWVRDGAVALKRVQDAAPAKRPHVIIVDLGLPGLDGTVLIRSARRMPHLVKVPIVVLSATMDEATSRKCQSAGATAFLSKLDLATDLNKWMQTITVEYAKQGRAAAAA
jgi:two-component system, cell cycle response regulator